MFETLTVMVVLHILNSNLASMKMRISMLLKKEWRVLIYNSQMHCAPPFSDATTIMMTHRSELIDNLEFTLKSILADMLPHIRMILSI